MNEPNHDADANLLDQLKVKDKALRKIHEAAGGIDFWLDDLKAFAEGQEKLERLYWPLLKNNATIRKLAEEAL